MKQAHLAPETRHPAPAAQRASAGAGTAAIVEAIDGSPRQRRQQQQVDAIARSPRGAAQRRTLSALTQLIQLSQPIPGMVVQREIGKNKDGEEIIRLTDRKAFRALLLPARSASGTHTYRLTAADEVVNDVPETDPAYASLNGEPHYTRPSAHQPQPVPLPAVLYHASPGRLNNNLPDARSWFTPNFQDALDYSNRTANTSLIYRYTVTNRLVDGLLLLQQQAQFAVPAATLLEQQGLTQAHGWLEDQSGVQSVFLKNPADFLSFSGVCGYIEPSIFSVPMGTPVVSRWTDWHASIDTLRTGSGQAFPLNQRGGHLGRYDRALADAI